MPWNDNANSGGPWGGGAGSGGGGNGGPKNPWGRPPSGGGPRRPRPGTTDIDQAIRNARERFSRFGGGMGGKGFSGLAAAVIAVVALLAWALTGVYFVDTQEEGVVLRFGAYDRTTSPGLRYHLPWPIEMAFTPEVTRQQQVNIGFEQDRGGQSRDVPTESLMLTQDENIVDIDFSVRWVISDAQAYLFNVENPEETVKAVGESAMREVVGNNQLESIITTERQAVELAARELMQGTLDEYGAGIQVSQVLLQRADPPERVVEAFRDVVNAGQDAETAVNQATGYLNQVVPEARGDAARIVQGAEGYREQVVADATGEAARFVSVLTEYERAPQVTRERLYLETLERLLARSDKIMLDPDAGNGVVPYLPLDQLTQRRAAPPAPAPVQSSTQGAQQ